MAKGFKHGAGGSNLLNFKVVGNPQPDDPKENTIWVDTDVKITGYVFSYTEPVAPYEGMVWILNGINSTVAFNALKKNIIQLYPKSAKQYIGGAWVAKTGKTYQGGKFVEWIPEGALYWDGIQVVDWIAKTTYGNASGWQVVAPVFDADSIDLQASQSYVTAVCGTVTKEKYNITGYSKLVFEFYGAINAFDAASINVSINNTQIDNWDGTSAIAKKSTATKVEKIELPFNATGMYYIDIFSMRNASCSIKRVYFE